MATVEIPLLPEADNVLAASVNPEPIEMAWRMEEASVPKSLDALKVKAAGAAELPVLLM
jgi:hypothetical protein